MVLQAKGLKKSFKGSGQGMILNGVDLALEAGQSLSVVGESGAGKSTLLNIVSGLDTADEGELFWQGEPVQGLSSSQLSQKRAAFLGIVFQSYYLIHELNVLENIVLGWQIAKAGGSVGERQDIDLRARKLLGFLGLSSKTEALPEKLSGGERQRVAIARALIHQPKVILADEPTGNLDEKTAKGVMELFLGLCKQEGVALVLVTHNIHFSKQTDTISVLHEGCLEYLQ
jgi:lipoprotein-releasing system ATP-binding protein